MIFTDRIDAGRQLGELLRDRASEDLVVVGLPRGGVPVAFEVAEALGAPMDVIVVRKLGVPSHPELAMGAIGEGGARVVDERIIRQARVSAADLAAVEERETGELGARLERFRRVRPAVPLTGRTVVVVDDGIATGSTARVACRIARAQGAARVILAVPVAPDDAIKGLRADADEVVCVDQSGAGWFAVGQAYADFTPTTDETVVGLLERAARRDQ